MRLVEGHRSAVVEFLGVSHRPAAGSILGRARPQPFVLVHRVAGDEQVPRDPIAKSVHRLLDVTGNIAADIHDRIPAPVAKRSVIARVPVTDKPGNLGEQVGARLAAAEQGHFGSGAQGVRHDGTANE